MIRISAALAVLAISTGMHQAHAASLLTKEQAENIAAQSIQMTSESLNMPLSQIKENFLFSILSSRGTTAYCGDLATDLGDRNQPR
jgi:hypothetical protein